MKGDLAGKISDSEVEVMKILWKADGALPITVIREELQRLKGWEPATIKTLVSRLVSKGAVCQEKRNNYYYSPNISEQEYSTWAADDLIERLYHGSARNLVAALVHSDNLTREDIEELRNMFKVED
ncbi:MAG: BlaI/MecI/CopY family transcriptional regulator [Oscillospiraceae bacterium]|nr:BlaI/MecI/CopY family transcriptional regulator [Oscillospiraceae bacterium]